ncbi:MAG TPA: LpqB family beta-propeller domain-containing protein [Pyrinomonadaceae bacterium]|nr:LpqB family beta-propeller domain-containing protein [Pyrinomonadaceae bacterium]
MKTPVRVSPAAYVTALLTLLACLAFSTAAQAQPQAVPYFTDPAISPDLSEIAFVSGGDIWTVSANGGDARLLVSHPATESRPLYSPDGKKLAFISSRTGNGDIYVLTLDSGDLKRITFDDSNDALDAWSADGKWLYFGSSSRDISGMSDIYRVSAEGGTPMIVAGDRFTGEYFSAPSPDGNTIALSGHGFGQSQWWRKGHSHIDESEIWFLRLGATPRYERISEGGAKEVWPMWHKDGRSVYYISDRSGAENIWLAEPGRKPRSLTNFTSGRAIWPSISYDRRIIVFNRDSQIWKFDTSNNRASAVAIIRRGASTGPTVEHLRLSDQISEMALSPDGKKIAFVVRGEVFAATASDGGDAARVTNSPAEEGQITWSPDSRRLVYVSDRAGVDHIFAYDFGSNAETQLTNASASDSTPRFSPDGKLIAFERGGEDIRVLEVETKKERSIARGQLERPPLESDRNFVWSPDSKWIAYMPIGERLFKNVFVVPVSGGESRALSFLANGNSNTVSWSPDGTYILFDTNQRTEDGQLARIDLLQRVPKFREDQFRDLFKEEPSKIPPTRQPDPTSTPSPAPVPSPSASPLPVLPPAADAKGKPTPKPVEITFDQIRRRLTMLPVGLDVNYQTISSDGKWVLMIAVVANQQNLYVFPLDELSREPAIARQLTSTAGFKRWAQFSPDNKEVYYLEQGRINIYNMDNRQTRPLAVSAELDVDFARERGEVFRQAWTYLRDNFYDSKFHGADWNQVRAQYEPLAAGARTPDELRRIISLMLGELNASHLGISAPAANATAPATGRLGVRFDRNEYERAGALRITEVIPLTPAAIGNIKVGEYLLSVDGVPIKANINLDEMLAYKINRRVVLTVGSSPAGAQKREVVLRPSNGATERGLLYRNWVEENRAYVAKASNGRLGYVHMPDMGFGSLTQFYIDLDVENQKRDGVVVDMRNNNGGFVNVYAIDVLLRKSYFSMQPRGFSNSAPSRSHLGQRALELPTILVVNRHTLSDGEDFTEGYRSQKVGKVVGEPTAGWIIFTSGTGLIDGSVLRLPFEKITATDGTVMEMNPRPVDVAVDKPLGESYEGKDSQLDAAVRELLKDIGPKRP